jgi:thiamine pyrophosphate-dependent acetolactate synthase large subunit-like protein
MYAPGAMWTAARHKIPFLSVLHNNKGYHQEVMHVQRMSNRRNRVANLGTEIRDNGPVGTRIENPDIDYSKIASGMGWWTSGQVADPKELGAVLKKAVDVVKSGQPALVDVISQPR